jgi:hypothetical protein
LAWRRPWTPPQDVEELESPPRKRSPFGTARCWKTILRLGVSIGALVVAALVLKPVYSDLDLTTVKDAITSLSAGEWAAFLAVFAATIWANGLLTASVVPKLPIRRGVTAYLGSSAVASTFPGPGDPPSASRCTASWGRNTTLRLGGGQRMGPPWARWSRRRSPPSLFVAAA